MTRFGLLLLVAGLSGCVACAPSPMYDPSPQASWSMDRADADGAEGSLFPSDLAVLSNDAIAAVLGTSVRIPASGRLAVIQVSRPRHRYWSEDLMRLDEQVSRTLADTLMESPRLGEVLIMPRLLLPEKMTIPMVREAAARCQAPLVLLYQVQTRSYNKQKFLAADRTRAYCNVEAVLLDTRSGIVLHVATASQSYDAAKTGDDLSFAETMWKAEIAATDQALQQIAANMTTYLQSVPTGQEQGS